MEIWNANFENDDAIDTIKLINEFTINFNHSSLIVYYSGNTRLIPVTECNEYFAEENEKIHQELEIIKKENYKLQNENEHLHIMLDYYEETEKRIRGGRKRLLNKIKKLKKQMHDKEFRASLEKQILKSEISTLDYKIYELKKTIKSSREQNIKLGVKLYTQFSNFKKSK